MLTPVYESFPVALLATVALHVAEGEEEGVDEVDETVVVVTGLLVVVVAGLEVIDELELDAVPGRH
jgi:hypothetical protein